MLGKRSKDQCGNKNLNSYGRRSIIIFNIHFWGDRGWIFVKTICQIINFYLIPKGETYLSQWLHTAFNLYKAGLLVQWKLSEVHLTCERTSHSEKNQSTESIVRNIWYWQFKYFTVSNLLSELFGIFFKNKDVRFFHYLFLTELWNTWDEVIRSTDLHLMTEREIPNQILGFKYSSWIDKLMSW